MRSSRTRLLTAAFADAWRARGADHRVVTRDLHADPLPHFSTPALHWAEALRGAEPVPADQDALQASVIAELLAADVVVIGAPMYNYSMPSTLKAWIDLIHVPGTTTSPVDSERPLRDRSAVIVTARGASYDAGSPTEGWDHVVPPLRLVLENALGMRVHVIETSRTLADRFPDLDADRAAAELAAARDEATRLGTTL